MDKITFENATLVNPAKVTIDGVDYEVTPEETSGGTTASANTFNTMQENIEKSVVAVSTTQPSTSENVWFKKGKNLFNKNTIFRGYIETSSQKIVSAQDEFYSCYAKVNPNTIYTVSKQAGKSFRIATTTSVPINGTTYNNTSANHTGTNITITTGANDNYICVFFYADSNGDTGGYENMANTLQVEQNSTATTYEPYVNKEILVKNDNNVFERFADIDEIENSIHDTGWIPIQFTSNDWKAREGSNMYAPKFRKIGNVVFLQGQFATNQILNPGTYNIVTTNLPEPDKQHTICTCSYTGKLVNMWIVGKTISLRVFDNNFNDAIGVSIDSCYMELTTD